MAFVSLGCFKNLVDTEVLGGMLETRGLRIVSAYEPCDWLVINTCAFIREAKEESIDEVFAALEKKEKGEVRRIAVFGCLGQRYLADLRRSFPAADIIWGVNDVDELASLIASGAGGGAYRDRRPFLYSHAHRRILTTTPNSTFIKISEGCDMTCSFCAIPSIRGPFRSRPAESILAEAERCRAAGFSEINLVSQNSSHYGVDLGRPAGLAALLGGISRIGFDWVRVLYLMPEETTDEIIGAFGLPSIVPYFDLPFQHVSARVLRGMNRSGGVRRSLDLIGKIRGRHPGAVIRSSFIAGFPGESEADFSELLSFVSQSGIEYVGVFAYSDEEGTAAFGMRGKRPAAEIEERRRRLQAESDGNLERFFSSLRGSEQEFLPLGPWANGSTVGRIRCQAPEVDGLTVIKEKFSRHGRPFPVRIGGHHQEALQARRSSAPRAVARRAKTV